MFMLFALVAVALLVVVVAKVDRARPLGLAMLAVVAIALGGRAVALLTDATLSPLVSSAALAAEKGSDPASSASNLERPTAAAESAGEQLDGTIAGQDPSSPEGAEESVRSGNGPVTPVASVYIPPGRPKWVDSPPLLTGDVHQIAVASEPHSSKRECLRALDEKLKQAADEYINDYLGTTRAAALTRYSIKEINSKLVRPDNVYHEIIQVSFGPMHQSHALLELDSAFRGELEQRWSQVKAMNRLLQVGFGAGAVLLLLGTIFSYFKLDTATKGYYTGRLQFAAAGAILALVAASVLLARWIPWM